VASWQTTRRRTAELLDRFDLTDAAGKVVRSYSGGMRRKLDLAVSLIGRPSILFLDELQVRRVVLNCPTVMKVSRIK
jgi:ABC-type multidrug transport system ATPase subunit